MENPQLTDEKNIFLKFIDTQFWKTQLLKWVIPTGTTVQNPLLAENYKW